MVYNFAARFLSAVLSRDVYEMGRAFALTRENGVDPVDTARLVLALEKEYKLRIFDEKAAGWKTLGDACAHVERLLAEGEAEPLERSDADRTAWYYE